MIFKFSIGGQQIEAQTDNAAEAMQVLSAFAPKTTTAKTAPRVVKSHVVKAHKAYPYVKKAGNAPRSWQRWTMDEVRALNENKGLKTSQLIMVPLLAGRSKKTLVSMRATLRNPAQLKQAPSNFRKAAEIVLAEA